VDKVFRLGRTVSHFKTAQLGAKFQYRLVKFCYDKNIFPPPVKKNPHVHFVELIPSNCSSSVFKEGSFSFLNKEKRFQSSIDWNFSEYGQLWNIRLNSLEYLSHLDTSASDGKIVLFDFIKEIKKNRTRYDSHCASLRIINVIKFCSRYQIDIPEFNSFVFSQALYVRKNSEVHLSNNHLLENGFALLFASHFFGHEKLFHYSSKVLMKALDKQVLADGAHFELCPMYHLWTVNRLLECLQILKKSSFKVKSFVDVLEKKVSAMLGWIIQMQFANGSLPAVNDSSEGYGPGINAILKIAYDIGLKASIHPLKESGFRKFKNRNFEMLVDVNGLTPPEAPGHSHADTFHFILHVFGDPLIIDTGVSTYEPSKLRMHERSTAAHNTVVVNDLNQSEIYGTFRAGRRAKVNLLKCTSNELEASHNGYQHIGVKHTRTFSFGLDKIVITDKIIGKVPGKCSAFLHIDKKNRLVKKENELVSKFVNINFNNASNIEVKENYYAIAFGKQLPCYVVKIDFSGELVTTIRLNK
jgi:uncharacterized heparinase superfamily protein